MSGSLLCLLAIASLSAAPAVAADPVPSPSPTPRLIRQAPLHFPEASSKYNLSGRVVLRCRIDDAGNVTDAEYLTGHALFTQAAREAVLQWKFEPAREGGKPVASTIEVPFDFKDFTATIDNLLAALKSPDPLVRLRAGETLRDKSIWQFDDKKRAVRALEKAHTTEVDAEVAATLEAALDRLSPPRR